MQFNGKLATEIHRIALDLLCIRVIFKSKVVRGNRMAQKEKTETETEAVYIYRPRKLAFAMRSCKQQRKVWVQEQSILYICWYAPSWWEVRILRLLLSRRTEGLKPREVAALCSGGAILWGGVYQSDVLADND
jgi:hypothetical protein